MIIRVNTAFALVSKQFAAAIPCINECTTSRWSPLVDELNHAFSCQAKQGLNSCGFCDIGLADLFLGMAGFNKPKHTRGNYKGLLVEASGMVVTSLGHHILEPVHE